MTILRFYIDPDTGEPHIVRQGVIEEEVIEVMIGLGIRDHGLRLEPPGEEGTPTTTAEEDEACFRDTTETVMTVPRELVPAVRALMGKHRRDS